MTLYTPRGLKIRLQIGHAFALIARLYPRVDAWRVLKTTEGLELIPSVLVFITAMVCFSAHADVVHISMAVCLASVVGALITREGLYVIPGLPGLGTAYSYINGFGIIFIIQVCFAYITVGWLGLLAFYAGTIVASICNTLLESLYGRRMLKQAGFAFTESEHSFFSAYRLHALHLGVTTDIDVTDEECEPENWGPAFEQFASKWPEVVARWS